ncbi:MAG: cell division ATP-binding protein FtsE [Firmicutes bacterium]|nr:cell division ATP-binding protein FtsE [Bacillota bacterium]MBQ1891969.1 cell division ATP-binding protein FtsE [Bacillota bacterium]MBQ2042218.1 cell division ATP-binding protein FtsE [Bacillota bacterium]MBQ5414992.1 cell division ATP-binding protein FtsE [Bacillota bacterium]
MIDFKNVSKVYADTVALKNATLHIDQGDFVFVVGPTGSGKSTFIKLIIKEIEPDEGEIIVDGKNLSKMSNRDVAMLRRDIGMVFQDFKLLENKTVFENVSFAMEVVHSTKRAINRQVPQMLSVMGIDDKAKNYPSELSAGEQQRVAIARAIINNPRILIADEPTGNLDPDTAWEIMQLIELVNKRGTTVVMVTHAKDIVNRMNKRVVAIDQGEIIRDSREGEYGFDD